MQGGQQLPRRAADTASSNGKYWYLFKYTPADARRHCRPNGPPELTGKDLVESGITADVDPNSGQPIVAVAVHGPRLGRVQADHEGGVRPWSRQRGPGREAERWRRPDDHQPVRAAQRDRPRRPAPVDAVHRLHATRASPSGIAGNAQITEPQRGGGEPDLALVLQSGSLPYTFEQLAETERLGDARQELAPPGDPRRDRGPDHRRDLPARPLPLPRARRGLRPRDLRAPLLRGDPPLQRDADAAGLRRPDPHDRRRGRRERRRLRTHQGRGARRDARCAPRSRPVTARASTRFSTRTS